MLGLAAPSSGAVLFDGKPRTPDTFERLACVAERSVVYEWMSVREHLEMQRRAFARFNPKRAAELTELFALNPRQRVRSLSKGMRTALTIGLLALGALTIVYLALAVVQWRRVEA